jgi:hypothetical protein
MIHHNGAYPTYPKGKQVLIKGMNDIYVLSERRKKTHDLLNELHHMLIEEGYNPISKNIVQPVNESNIVTEVNPTTPFIHALKYSLIGLYKTLIQYKAVSGIPGERQNYKDTSQRRYC